MAKLTPNEGESAVDFLKRQAVEDCATDYLTKTDGLTDNVEFSRTGGVRAVFDLDATHANAVLAAVAAKTGKPQGVLVSQDLVARVLLESQTGADPGSPMPASMTLTPSDVPGYVAALTKMKEGFAELSALTYTVTTA